MTEPRRIAGKLVDFTADGSIIAHGTAGEHLILDLGPAHVINLFRAMERYIEYYRQKNGEGVKDDGKV